MNVILKKWKELPENNKGPKQKYIDSRLTVSASKYYIHSAFPDITEKQRIEKGTK